MDLKFKANRVGDIAIISGVIAFLICIFSIFFEIKFAALLSSVFTLLYSEMRHEYIEIRKQEIDEQILKEKNINK